MRMNINKATDLNSISAFPPNSRRANAALRRPQASQYRSQHSQQSFSQALSSQHGGLSQLTQNSSQEAMINDQRFCSQERDLSFRKASCLPPVNRAREDSQIQLSRSPSNLTHRWNPASLIENKRQTSEELEQRIGMIETSLSRLGMILESVQHDVMQVSKGAKEILLETEGLRQKLILHDTSLQLMNKGQADIKAGLDEGMKLVADQLSKALYHDKSQQISSLLSSLPELIESSSRKLQHELCNTFTREIQAITSVKMLDQTEPVTTFPAVKPARNLRNKSTISRRNAASGTAPTQRRPQIPLKPANTHVGHVKKCQSQKIEGGLRKSVYTKQARSGKRAAPKQVRRKDAVFPIELVVDEAAYVTNMRRSSLQQETVFKLTDSDEDSVAGLSCFLVDNTKGTGTYSIEKAKANAERMVRRAKRASRNSCNPIIVD